jgi:hypothetical protein
METTAVRSNKSTQGQIAEQKKICIGYQMVNNLLQSSFVATFL